MFVIFSVLLAGSPLGVVANAETGNGGQVNTTGKIIFYEEETSSSEVKQSVENSSEAISATTKPAGGQLPSTGERIRKYGFIGGGLLLLVLLIILCRKRQKTEEHL